VGISLKKEIPRSLGGKRAISQKVGKEGWGNRLPKVLEYKGTRERKKRKLKVPLWGRESLFFLGKKESLPALPWGERGGFFAWEKKKKTGP